ncbi:heptosyltransferase [Emticicia aquatilis]|uniref:Heptosyltransferase n=1 Tax=Emticicia aquatilis TaxID=1537369 RepID=A0A917DQ96_9BACT|nr:glycosyltransferase family 9 protein [Emticicia aquatilis]GGD56143.1 heptosyltransferase [Emticicia aquatilis]
MQKFIVLWLHRYKKYTHILNVYFRFLVDFSKIYIQKKILNKKVTAIILTQQFGDIVASEPLARQIRETHPNDIILWIVKPIFKELVVHNPNIDTIIDDFCANHRRLLINSGIFDTTYNLQFRNNSFCETCNIYVENLVANTKDITIHNYYFHGNLLNVQQKIAGFPTTNQSPQLHISKKEIEKVDTLSLPVKFIVVHCQSAQNSRNWDKSKWEKFIEFLIQNTDAKIIEIGLSSDLNINSERYINLCGKLSILETAEVIRRAKLFIGIDSGPAHLANAVGTFGVIMIGKLANFINHIPYSGQYKTGENAIIIRNTEGASAEIPVETVISTLLEKQLLPN